MTSTMSIVPIVPAMKEPIAARRQGLRGTAGLGHLVALDGRDDRGGLAGGVEQDRGRRAAVHAAVEDAGEEDERLLGSQPVGDRQQQRHGHGRPDAGEHPDGRADGDPEQRDQQVHRRDDVGEAAEECGEVVHQRIPCRMPAGRLTPEADRERVERDQASAMPIASPRTWWRLPSANAEPANSSAPLITQPSGSMSNALSRNAPASRPTVRQSARVAEVDVLAGLGLRRPRRGRRRGRTGPRPRAGRRR